MFDHDTPVWLDGAAVGDGGTSAKGYQCSTPSRTPPCYATRARLVDLPVLRWWQTPKIYRRSIVCFGSNESPDRSTICLVCRE